MKYPLPATGKKETQVTYLEMISRPEISLSHGDFNLKTWVRPKVDDYLDFYHRIGSSFYWTERKVMPTQELENILTSPQRFFFFLQKGEERRGYCEILENESKVFKIDYFGLLPDYTGQGGGSIFMTKILKLLWDELCAKKIWLHTCDLDHPKALLFYQKSGFKVYQSQKETVWTISQ